MLPAERIDAAAAKREILAVDIPARNRNAASLGARIAHAAVFGYKHHHVSITSVDATSRLPLYVISRILIDYLTKQLEEARAAAEKKESSAPQGALLLRKRFPKQNLPGTRRRAERTLSPA